MKNFLPQLCSQVSSIFILHQKQIRSLIHLLLFFSLVFMLIVIIIVIASFFMKKIIIFMKFM